MPVVVAAQVESNLAVVQYVKKGLSTATQPALLRDRTSSPSCQVTVMRQRVGGSVQDELQAL